LSPHGGCDEGPLPDSALSFTHSVNYSESSVSSALGLDCSSDKDLQRAKGSCRIVLAGSKKGTRVMELYQKSPLRILFPGTTGSRLEEAVLVNTSGGMAGGDRLETSVTAVEDASIAITTQAAERVYRALTESAHILTTLKTRSTARLAWLPQETIVFNRARLSRETRVEVVSGTELLALEWLVLGRAAHGETLSAAAITDRWRIVKDGKLVWADSFRITDDVLPNLWRKALLCDCTATATLVYFGAESGGRLEFVRDRASSLGCHCGVTFVGGLMVARFAARASCDLRTALRSVLQQFGDGLPQGPFQVPKMWSC